MNPNFTEYKFPGPSKTKLAVTSQFPEERELQFVAFITICTLEPPTDITMVSLSEVCFKMCIVYAPDLGAWKYPE